MNKKIVAIFTICMLVLCVACGCVVDNDSPPEPDTTPAYYFDSAAPDNGDGSAEHPYNVLDSVAGLRLVAGDIVAFRAGSKFSGSLRLVNITGTADKPIVFTSYGDVATLGKPKFNGGGLVGSAVVYIENCQYLTVENMDIYDETIVEGDRRGVLVNATNPSGNDDIVTYSGLTLQNLYVHDIHGIVNAENKGLSLASKVTGGVHVWTSDGKGRFDRLTIRANKIENVENVGIATWYTPTLKASEKISPYSAEFERYAYTNVTIADNEICYVGKNAIFARHLLGGKISGNTMYETAIKCYAGNTVCTSFVWGTVVEHNEGAYNRATLQDDGKLQDGCMLDADLQSRDTVWQYNYSHDNAFGLFINCTTYDPDNGIEDVATVRYNLSVHDYGQKGVVYVNYAAKNIRIHNNTFVLSAETSPIIIKSNAKRNFEFVDNIICNYSPDAGFDIATYATATISNNLVYDLSECIDGWADFVVANKKGLYVDPAFVGVYSDQTERRGGEIAELFKLLPASPAYGKSTNIGGTTDYFGNPYANCIGFYCGR